MSEPTTTDEMPEATQQRTADIALDAHQVAVAALRSLPSMTDARLRGLLDAFDPRTAYSVVANHQVSGSDTLRNALRSCRDVDRATAQWQREATTGLLERTEQLLRDLAVRVWWPARNTLERAVDERPPLANLFDPLFLDDDERPEVLFATGRLDALGHARVAMVGTRGATGVGRQMATLLGKQLSHQRVSVVSGLALGIDGASHRGALSGPTPPIGVVGTGIDVVYPQAHRALWNDIRERGLLLSEQPMGRGPTAPAFPQRNRIIAQLAHALVVVESRAAGGSMITVDRALERGRPILAVPGSPLSEASDGTNALLRGGGERVALPCVGIADVLAVLDLAVADDPLMHDMRPDPPAEDLAVLVAMGWEGWTVSRLATTSGVAIGALSLALSRLERDGWVVRQGGRWHRCAVPGS